VERKNTAAIALYTKNGMSVQFESYHFIIDIYHLSNHIIPHLNSKDYHLRELKNLGEHILNELRILSPFTNMTYLEFLFSEDQQRDVPRNVFLGLYKGNQIRGFARFNQEFSGSMPYIFGTGDESDILLFHLLSYKLEKNDHLRMTFDGKPEYATTLKKRGYTVHHELFKMEKIFSE